MKYIVMLFCIINQVHACWFYSKQHTVDKIRKMLETAHVQALTKDYVTSLTKTLPAPVSWAINTIGVETAYKDCDMNMDGILTVQEMSDSVTCLASCSKLAIVNSVL